MACGGRRLFIYYRLTEGELAAACAAVRRAQQALCDAHPGLVAELLQRPQVSSDGERTVMETYALAASADPAGVDPALQATIEAALTAALRPWLRQPRHVEVFTGLT